MKIMAPAGDSSRLDAALKAGADEVYMGLSGFGARRFAKNFSADEYCAAIDQAHRVGASVHLTFNTILSDSELELVYPEMKRLYETGLDAVIVQDFGVVSWFKEFFPDLNLCASTQLSPANGIEADWYKSQGFSRVVLARELSLDEIRSIRRKTDVELEVFVSGALCLGCSGKCYLSSFIGGRSGNRGMCAQPCRQYYRAETLEGEDSTIDGEYGYFLSLRDQLQGSAELKTLSEIGVESLKIEGRMKSPAYVYETVRYYRDLVDALSGVAPQTASKRLAIKSAPTVDARVEEERRDDVAALFNRGYDRGYFYEHDPAMINEFYSSNFGVEVGRVRRGAVRLSKSLRNGDGVVFLDETARKLGGLNVSGIRLIDPTNSRRSRIVESAEPGDLVQFHDPVPEDATVLYRTFNHRLNKEIDVALQQTRRHEPINAKLVARVGRPLELSLSTERASATVRSDQDVAPAQKKGTDRAALLDALDRFGETPFYLDKTRLEFDQNAFVPKSLLNALRQRASEELERAILDSFRRVAPEKAAVAPAEPSASETTSALRAFAPEEILKRLAASVRNRAQYDACRACGIRKIYYETRPAQFESRFRFCNSEALAPIAGSLVEALRLEKHGRPYALSWFFNVANARATRFLAENLPNVDVVYLSPEISDRAVATLIENYSSNPIERPIVFGLPIYGRLLAMYTQKTLFEEPRVRLVNADDRRLIVERNSKFVSDAFGDFTAAFAPSDSDQPPVAPPTGSSIYLDAQLNLLDVVPRMIESGVGELLLTFTNETIAEIRRVIERACAASRAEQVKTFSYGYTRDGVF